MRQAQPPTSTRSRLVRRREYRDTSPANVSFGLDLFRGGRQGSRLSLQLDIENITDNPYLMAQEGEFSPAQFAIPRLIAAAATVRF